MSTGVATVSVEEAGKILGVSRGTAYMLARTGRIPVLRLGKRLVVPKVGLDRLLEGASSPNQSRRKRVLALA